MHYLITFACYGCHLHGDAGGSVDPRHNARGTPVLETNLRRARFEQNVMQQAPYELDASRREVVLKAIQDVCRYRAWQLLAAHVRTDHVHVVVDAEAEPERVMNDLKAYASRALNALGLERRDRRRWARHGSTRWLKTSQGVAAAMEYVVAGQGEMMTVYQAEE